MNLMNWLRDGIWQFIGVVLALFAILITLRQNSRKSISFEIVADISILNAKGDNDELKVYYKGTPINDPRLVEIRIFNSGNTSISRSDYEKPLEIAFGFNCVVVDAEVVDTYPKDIEVQLAISNGKLTFSSGLLNSGDSVKVRVLLDGNKGQAIIKGRIVGVRQIQENLLRKMQFKLPEWVWDLNALLCSGAALGISIALLIVRMNNGTQGWLLPVLAFCLGCIGGIGISRETSVHKKISRRTSFTVATILLSTTGLFLGAVTMIAILSLFN